MLKSFYKLAHTYMMIGINIIGNEIAIGANHLVLHFVLLSLIVIFCLVSCVLLVFLCPHITSMTSRTKFQCILSTINDYRDTVCDYICSLILMHRSFLFDS